MPMAATNLLSSVDKNAMGATQTGAQSGKKSAGTTKKAGPVLKSSAGFATDEKSFNHGSMGIGGTVVNLENITIASYVCDFGNVVVGATKKKSFRLTNVGKIPVTFNFDKKILT